MIDTNNAVNILFITISFILLLISVILISRGSLIINGTNAKGWKKLNGRGKKIVLIYLFMLVINIGQSIFNSHTIKKKEEQLRIEQDNRAKIIQEEVSEAYNKLFESMSISFSKQGLEIDSLHGVISTLENIKYITNNNIAQSEPFFHIITQELEIKDDAIYFGFYVKDAGLTDMNATYTLIVDWINGSRIFFTEPFLVADFPIPANTIINKTKLVDFNRDASKIEKLSIQFKGTFSNLQNSNTFPFNFVYSYNKQEQKFKRLFRSEKDSIENLIQLNNAKKSN